MNSPTCWPRDVTTQHVGVVRVRGSAMKEEEEWGGNRKTVLRRKRERERGRKGRARGERTPRINATARPGGQNLRIPAGYRAIRRNTRSRGLQAVRGFNDGHGDIYLGRRSKVDGRTRVCRNRPIDIVPPTTRVGGS